MSAILLHHARETALVDEFLRQMTPRLEDHQVAPICMINLMNTESTDMVQ